MKKFWDILLCFVPDIMVVLFYSIILFSISGLIFYYNAITKEEETTYQVERVFMHTVNSYSFLIFDKDTKEIKSVGFGECKKITADVELEKPMWIKVKKTSFRTGDDEYFVEIHIHSVKDINGGGWNRGKFGSGQTSVVE
jgi:hypothetical protein